MAVNKKNDQPREAAGAVGKKIGEEAAVMGAESIGIPRGIPGVDGAVRSIGGSIGEKVAQQGYDQVSSKTTNAMSPLVPSPSFMNKLKASVSKLPSPKESATPESAPNLDNNMGPKMGRH